MALFDSSQLTTVVLAMLPVSELRGAIPFAILVLNEPPWKALWLSIFGNFIPVIPLLIIFSSCFKWLESGDVKDRPFLIKSFLNLLFEHARKRAKGIERLEALGLAIFVAVPFPGTGAWTGCIIAALFKLRFFYALLSIIAGIIIAGVVVTWMTLFGKMTVGLIL